MNNSDPEKFSLTTCVESPDDYKAEPKLYCQVNCSDNIHVTLTTCPAMTSGSVKYLPVKELYSLITTRLKYFTVTVHTTTIDTIGVTYVPNVVKGNSIETSPVEIGNLKIYADGSFSVKDVISDGKRVQPRVGATTTTLFNDDPLAEQIKSAMTSASVYALIELELDHHGHLICHTARLGASGSVMVYSSPFDMRALHENIATMPSILFLGLHCLGGPILEPKCGLYKWIASNGVEYTLEDTKDGGQGHVLILDVLGG